MTLTVGSLCSGFEGLSQGLTLAGWPVELAWVAEYDPTPDRTTKKPKPEPQAAQRVLAHRYPGVPNWGDITAVNWADVPPVDIITAGFPCTDVSCAGRRAGMGAGTRSGVWAHVANAIAVLRPSIVVIENVAALLSTRANRSTDAPPLATWNPDRQEWETDQADLFFGQQEPWWATWPRSGMTRSGRLFPLPPSAHPTAGSGSSSSPGLPTPRASDTGTRGRRSGKGWRPPLSEALFDLLDLMEGQG